MVDKLDKAIKEIMVVEKLIYAKDIVLTSSVIGTNDSQTVQLTNGTFTLPTSGDFFKISCQDIMVYNWGRYPTERSTVSMSSTETLTVTYETAQEYLQENSRKIRGYGATNQVGVFVPWGNKFVKPTSSTLINLNVPEEQLPKDMITRTGGFNKMGTLITSTLQMNNVKLQLTLSSETVQYYNMKGTSRLNLTLNLPLHIEAYQYTTLNVQV